MERNEPPGCCDEAPPLCAPIRAGRLSVAMDDSCLFHCFSTAVASTSSSKPSTESLREICAQEALDSADQEAKALAVDAQTISEYADRIRSPHAWGGENEIVVLSNHFSLEVAVVCTASLSVSYYGCSNPGRRSRIYLLYTGKHYDLLVAEQAQEDDCGDQGQQCLIQPSDPFVAALEASMMQIALDHLRSDGPSVDIKKDCADLNVCINRIVKEMELNGPTAALKGAKKSGSEWSRLMTQLRGIFDIKYQRALQACDESKTNLEAKAVAEVEESTCQDSEDEPVSEQKGDSEPEESRVEADSEPEERVERLQEEEAPETPVCERADLLEQEIAAQEETESPDETEAQSEEAVAEPLENVVADIPEAAAEADDSIQEFSEQTQQVLVATAEPAAVFSCETCEAEQSDVDAAEPSADVFNAVVEALAAPPQLTSTEPGAALAAVERHAPGESIKVSDAQQSTAMPKKARRAVVTKLPQSSKPKKLSKAAPKTAKAKPSLSPVAEKTSRSARDKAERLWRKLTKRSSLICLAMFLISLPLALPMLLIYLGDLESTKFSAYGAYGTYAA